MNKDIRDIVSTINDEIPPDYIEFKQSLKNYIETSIWNKAPEVRVSKEMYLPFLSILLQYIPNLSELTDNDPVWMFSVRNIFANECIEKK
jgi:hypothetical protein